MDMVNNISQKDREVLRDLAKHQLEVANSKRNLETIKEWYKLNECNNSRPLIHLEMGTFEQEIIPKRLMCEGDLARKIETVLYRNFLNFELIGDDRVVADYYGINWKTYFVPFDIEVKVQHTSSESVGHQFVHQITNIKEFSKIMKKSRYGVDRQWTREYKKIVEDVIGDILPVKMEGKAVYSVPTQDLVHLMGMEQMFMSMYDYPDEFKYVMNRLADDYIEFFGFCEQEGLHMPTVSHEHLGQGSYCYNNSLPREGYIKTKDIWGFMDSQETVGISPSMFEEFIFPYYKKIADQVGRLSYGCCEPVDSIWDNCVSKFHNLGKVSISPWCNQEFMGEQLRNTNIVFHRKPSPNYLGVDVNLDESAFKGHILETLKAAQGCTLEITQRDVYTIHNNEDKAKRYVQIIREAIEESW